MEKKVFGRVAYSFATSFISNKILLNNIPELDENIWENIPSVYNEEEDEYPEIYQWYLTDISSESEANWLMETFELILAYSDTFECWVLCVPHFGTAWDGVGCDVYSESFWSARGKENEFKY